MLVTFCISFAALASFSVAEDYCGNGIVMENLEIPKMKGVWWEWEFAGTNGFLKPRFCHAINFYPQQDGKTIKTIHDYAHISDNFEEKHDLLHWTISDEALAKNGKLVVQLDSTKDKKVPFSILGTDYDNYLFVMMCEKNKENEYRTLMTLTRKSVMTEEEMTQIVSNVDADLYRSGLLKRHYLGLNHAEVSTKDCKQPQFPETA